MMEMDPDYFNIKQCQEMGLWPPGDQVVFGIMPYIKRLKFEKIRVVDVGVMRGHNARWMLDLDTENKIEKIYGVHSFASDFPSDKDRYKKLVEEDMKNEPRFEIGFDPYKKKNEVEVVCINADSDLDKSLKRFYRCVRSGGIFCGNLHAAERVKVALTKFRRENRIGTPIHVSRGSWFWVVR